MKMMQHIESINVRRSTEKETYTSLEMCLIFCAKICTPMFLKAPFSESLDQFCNGEKKVVLKVINIQNV